MIMRKKLLTAAIFQGGSNLPSITEHSVGPPVTREGAQRHAAASWPFPTTITETFAHGHLIVTKPVGCKEKTPALKRCPRGYGHEFE